MEPIVIPIVIPSKGRASSIITHRYVDNSIICVAESEAEEYKKYNKGCRIDPHPDSIIGLMAKRDWIYKNYGNVFMIDDDVKGLLRMTQKAKESSKVSKELAYSIIQNAGNMAKMMGCYLFSFNGQRSPLYYSGHEPFSLTGCICGSAFGILEGADKLDKSTFVNQAYEWYISGLNAYHYRKLFIDNRFMLNKPAYEYAIGGLSNFRTVEGEESDLKKLVACFGNALTGTFREAGGKNQFKKKLLIPF